MPFHNYTKPSDYILPSTATRSNFIFDSDLVSGNVRFTLDYPRGPVQSTFTNADGFIYHVQMDRGIASDGSRARWEAGGEVRILGNKLASAETGAGAMIFHNAVTGADADITVEVSAFVEAGIFFRYGTNSTSGPGGTGGTGKTTVTIVPPGSTTGYPAPMKGFILGQEDFNSYRTYLFNGTTPIVAGTTYTLRVVVVGTTYTVYLNGALEGSFTSTANPTSVLHGPCTSFDPDARMDNFAIAAAALPAATAWTVRNYEGDILATGTPTGDVIDVPDSALKQRSNRGPYGWYRLYLTGPDHGDGQWNTSYGDCAFMRIPNSNLPFNGTPTQQAGWQLGVASTAGNDEIARGVMGMGTGRYAILNAATPASTTIAELLPAVAAAKTWQTDTASAARPRRVLIGFPNGTLGNEANITAIVSGLKNYVTAWEGRNEPNFTPAYADGGVWATTEHAPFYNAVKAGDPNAVVMGPGNVSFNDGGIGYFSQFLQGGGGNYSDAFSIHPYNCYNGDLALSRHTLGFVKQLITFFYGLPERDLWMTEQGFGWNYAGLIYPRYSARWTSMMYFAQEVITHGRLRPETTAYWYDVDIGFQAFPMQWLTPAGPGPTVAPVRTMSAETWNKTFTSEFDFGDTVTLTGTYHETINGSYAQNLYIGGTWSGVDGTKVVGLMASSYGATDLVMDVTGASIVTCVDPWGNTFTLAVSGGRITFPISELPQWIRCPVGVTVTPVPLGLTTNLARTATLTTDAVSRPGTYDGVNQYQGAGGSPFDNTNIAILANGLQENQHGSLNAPGAFGGCIIFAPVLPFNITLTWPSPIQANRVVMHTYPPWQSNGIPIALHIDTWDGATWTTRYTKSRPPAKSFPFTSGFAKCTYETFWDEQWIFDAQFSSVTTTKIRVVIDDCSFASGETGPGGAYDALWGGFGGGLDGGPPGTVQTCRIREIEVFSPSTVLASRIRNPAMGGVTG